MSEYKLVKIGDSEYPMMFVNRVLTRAMRKHKIDLKEFNTALSDYDFLYEVIFQMVRYASNRFGFDFKYKDDFEGFGYLLDDEGQEKIEECLEIINDAFDTQEDEEVEEKKTSQEVQA